MISSYINFLAVKQDSALDFFRTVLFNISSGIYYLVSGIFELFFKITDYTMFDNDMIKGLFNRLFVVIGVFMLFKLCISFISYLINPETMKDKDRGIGKLFGRLITMLILLYLLMPQSNFTLWGDDTACRAYSSNIEQCPDATAREIYKTNSRYEANGLLFGALYDLQSRIINDGTISKLILGEDLSTSGGLSNLNVGENVATTIHKAFFSEAGTCDTIAADTLEEATKKDDLSLILNYECLQGNYVGYYMFEYNGFMAIIVGLGVLIIVFLFCFDVAVRMIKLGILRLLSPIPAISYIDPKSSRDGMFANYVKVLTSTYLDLFLRLAIIYLVIFIIADIAQNDQTIFQGPSGGVAKVIVYVSLLFFASQAPKFIMQSLGIKSRGTGLGFGASLLGGALSGAISGYATGGAWGALTGLATGAKAGSQNQWAAQNGQNPNVSATQAARDRVAQNNTGNYNAKGRSLTSMVGSRIGNKIKGMDRSDVDTAKDNMYYLEGKARSAQNDFTNNIDGVVDAPNSSKWSDLAKQDQKAVENATKAVTTAKRNLEALKMQASAGAAVDIVDFNKAQKAVTDAEIALTDAQQKQQKDYNDYNNFINAEYGKAKKHYEIGDENLKRTDERHVYRSRPHVFGSENTDAYNYNGGNGGRYNKFDEHHPHK